MDFEELGLSLNQSRVLITLIKYGKAKASDISQLSGVPRAKVYSVLDQLVNLGLVDKKPGRPVKYRAKTPEEIVKRIRYNIEVEYENRIKRLEKIEKGLIDVLSDIYKPAEVEHSELIKVVKVGEPSIRETRLMYSEAKDEINVISKVFEYYPDVRDELIKASKRGVKIKVLLLSRDFLNDYSFSVQSMILEDLKKIAEVRFSKGLLPLRGSIIDPSYEYRTGKAIFVVEDPKTPLYLRDAVITENPSLVAGMKRYFDLIWKYESEIA